MTDIMIQLQTAFDRRDGHLSDGVAAHPAHDLLGERLEACST